VITYQGRLFEHEPGETVLTCLERHGVEVPSFCRSGVCQSCLLKVTEGTPPPKAQVGLKDSWKRQGQILSCVCEITEPLTLEPSDATQTYSSRVVATEYLSPTVLRVVVERPPTFAFEGGQFVQLGRAHDRVSRPYSIASLPSDEHLEFHIAVYPGGELSPWFASAQGEPVFITGPFGECTYSPDEPERPLVLAGTGTGLAPLVAVLRAALAANHRGPIALYHGARTAEELYYWTQLQELEVPPHVMFRGVYLEGPSPEQTSVSNGDLVPLVLSQHPKPDTARIYLCGSPTLVQTLKKRLYLAGASLARIHSDPFLPKGATN
jgi:CDP-4-dehydro-6-deoxyglucose reductase